MTHAHDEDENELGWVTQNPQIEALKACPFCGGEAERFENELTGLMTMVRCRQCGAEAFDAEWNRRASQEAAVPSEEPVATFQDRVQPWMMACFGAEISGDKVERGDRLLEEVLELLQSGGYDPARVGALRDYVWGRPAGEPPQEVGGVQVTLAAYCLAFGLDMHVAGETELARIWTKVDKIRAKQAAKPVGSALPVASPAVAPVASVNLVGAANDYMTAVKRLGQQSGYNGLTFFEAPISNMPNDELGMEAVRRWQALNDTGKALTAALAALSAQDTDGVAKAAYPPSDTDEKAQPATVTKAASVMLAALKDVDAVGLLNPTGSRAVEAARYSVRDAIAIAEGRI